MKLLIPTAACQAGVVVGGFVYLVISTGGEVTGMFVSKVALGASLISGGVVGLLGGPIAGSITAATVKELADGYFVPAVRTGSRLTGLGIAAGAGLAAVAVVSLVLVGGQWIIERISGAGKQEVTPIDYLLLTDGDFTVVTLEAVLGNPIGIQSGGGKN